MITKVVIRKYSKASANLRESERKLSELEGKGQEMELKVALDFFVLRSSQFSSVVSACLHRVKCTICSGSWHGRTDEDVETRVRDKAGQHQHFCQYQTTSTPLFLMLIIKVLEWHAKLEELRIRVSKRQTNYWHHPF